MLVTPGDLPFTSSSRGPVAVASAISPNPTETRSIGIELSMRTDFPTVSTRLVGGAVSDDTAVPDATGSWPSARCPGPALSNANAIRHAGGIITTPRRPVLTALLKAG